LASHTLDLPRDDARFFIFVIPLAFISYYPAIFLLDRSDALGLPGWLAFCSVAAAFGLAATGLAGEIASLSKHGGSNVMS
jgi:ABC-2 type transport system permease protein